MTGIDAVAIGGLVCGVLAGASARYGRLCTFAAIEDALVAGDLRRARAFALALAVAIAATTALVHLGWIDPTSSGHAAPRIELLALTLGAILFGLGMALVGTCGFGLLVRAGSGDLRALVVAGLLGIVAFAVTGGPLAGLRHWLAQAGEIRLPAKAGLLAAWVSATVGAGAATAVASALALFALSSQRVLQRPRMIAAAVLLGAAVAGGWLVTGVLADPFAGQRLESLTFVAPIGRLLLVTMGASVASSGFAILTVVGVVLGSFLVAAGRRELRWEAFDDQREMRRHLLGAMLMGAGGVLARGCTIGQGLSAGSLLAMSAPVAVLGFVLGARLGLSYLLGRPSQNMARRPWVPR